MVYCSSCCKNVMGERPHDSSLCCNICGRVLEEYHFSLDAQFVKDSSGQSKLAGNFVNSIRGEFASRARTLDKAYSNMMAMKDLLSIDDYTVDLVETAKRFYLVALERNFTRGRKTELVEASCLYLACWEKRKPYLLIDFSNLLKVNVYELGSVYLQLCYVLYLADSRTIHKLVDPSIFIHKFTNMLLPNEQEGRSEVVKTARDILASMKRDWMQTGRKPSGLCGAALYISALSHGFKFSKTDIIKIVHVCEATLTKRLVEFENTDAGSLTMEEFMDKELEIRTTAIKKPTSRPKQSGEVLCGHQGSKLFAYGLCEECYDDFMKVSGGLEGGSDPPAFQRAEKQRMAESSTEQNGSIKRVCDSPLLNGHEIPETIGAPMKQAVDDNDKFPVGSTEACSESDGFSDIDDSEVDGYLHNEEETQYKKIIWEEMNREYLEEQAAKEAAAAAAREAYAATYDKCPEDLQAAQELAAAAAAAVAKSRKERQQQRAAEAKSLTPAQTAAEATRRMLTKKRLSSKINYEALDKLFDELDPEKLKKKRIDSHSDEEEKVTKIDEEHKIENGYKTSNQELKDDYSEDVDPEEAYGNDLAFENEDEVYDYDDDYQYDGF